MSPRRSSCSRSEGCELPSLDFQSVSSLSCHQLRRIEAALTFALPRAGANAPQELLLTTRYHACLPIVSIVGTHALSRLWLCPARSVDELNKCFEPPAPKSASQSFYLLSHLISCRITFVQGSPLYRHVRHREAARGK